MKRVFVIILSIVLSACNLPRQTPTPGAGAANSSRQCAFVEARQDIPGLSAQFLKGLKEAGLPVETARAEGYGENCVAADGSIVSFAAMETDFYVTLAVTGLSDEAALGQYLEKIVVIIKQVPSDQTGPNPGYIGVTFKAGEQLQNLWFTQVQAAAAQAQGLTGADLYKALSSKP